MVVQKLNLDHIREISDRANSMKELFQKIEMNNVISLQKRVIEYRKI